MGDGTPVSMSRTRRFLAVLCFLLACGPAAAAPGDNPDFDAAPFVPLGCDTADLIHHPATTQPHLDFVGDATFPPAYVARDASYLYFRYRLDGDPQAPDFAAARFKGSSAWTALVQSPGGDAFTYQFQLTLDGDGTDPLRIYANTTALPIEFSPLFNDPSEAPSIFAQPFTALREGINTTPLARARLTPDGPSGGFNGTLDYFLEFAFPVADLVAQGVINSAEQLAEVLVFPATTSVPNRYNRSHLNCRFQPMAPLAMAQSATPTLLPANATTHVAFTIGTRNDGTAPARGIRLTTDEALPAYMTNVQVTVTSSDPGVTATVVTPNPLEVLVPRLPPGATVAVTMAADATPVCADVPFTNVARAEGTNADPASATATVQIEAAGATEVCDGIDNDCDQQVDEGGNALCPDSNLCDGTATCAGTAGCQPGSPPDCSDPNPCTADTCDPAAGCLHTPIPGCCTTPAECDDGNGCTTDTCDANVCVNTSPPGCRPCTTAAECGDANPCTTDVCTASGVCENPARPSCTPCTTAAECNDGDPCTSDTCAGDGTCTASAIPGCQRCTIDGECEDGDACTTDVCTGGVCQRTAVPECCVPAPEACADGADNDCDGARDCDDSDCEGVPACAVAPEVCGNCTDDDGDRLVDYEDPECCPQQQVLGMQRMLVGRTRTGNRLRLEARYAAIPAPLFDPLRQDTTLQISDETGTVFCTTIPMSSWKRPSLHVFRFRGQGQLGGLKDGGFTIERSGGVMFRARGRKAVLRDTNGQAIQVTVRVGNECARSTSTALRQARKGLVFP
jgi:hypothetical protein